MRYRREALRELDAPEQLDRAVRLATVPGWLITGVLVLLVGGAGFWAATTTIPRTVDARGLITYPSGVARIQAPVGGVLMQIRAGVGQRISRGDPLYGVSAAGSGSRVVTAPWDAYVTSWLAQEGQVLQRGAAVAEILRIEAPGGPLHARVYLRSSYAPAVAVGMPVEVEADAAPAVDFGTVRGTVVAVGQVPENESSLRRFLGDSPLVGRLLADGGIVAVTLSLAADPASPSGLRWSGSGPSFPLTPQSEVTARFTVGAERPADWLLGR